MLGYAASTFTDNCIVGIQADSARCMELLNSSVGTVTAISPCVGYAKASEIAKKALREKKSIRDLIQEENLMEGQDLDKVLDPYRMTEPEEYQRR